MEKWKETEAELAVVQAKYVAALEAVGKAKQEVESIGAQRDALRKRQLVELQEAVDAKERLERNAVGAM